MSKQKINSIKDPEALQNLIKNCIKKSGNKSKIIVGLDLGTNCGYCYAIINNSGFQINPWQMGQLDLSAGPYDSGAIRFVRLRHFLAAMKPNLIAYEDVKFTPSGSDVAGKTNKFSISRVLARSAKASELIGAFRATTACWAEENNIPCFGIPIGEIKKRATNKGNADKIEIIEACNSMFNTDFDPNSYKTTGVDNIADAAFVCLIACEQYYKGL